jgi:hypothetical protein
MRSHQTDSGSIALNWKDREMPAGAKLRINRYFSAFLKPRGQSGMGTSGPDDVDAGRLVTRDPAMAPERERRTLDPPS